MATELRIPQRTAQHWLRCWVAQGVPGIRTEPSRGRYGVRYAVDRALVAAWRRCELPAPRLAA